MFLGMVCRRTTWTSYVLLRGFLATTRKHVRREKLSQIKKRHRIFARKRYTVTVNGISVSPSRFCCALNSRFSFDVPYTSVKYTGITLFGSFDLRQILSFTCVHPIGKPREFQVFCTDSETAMLNG